MAICEKYHSDLIYVRMLCKKIFNFVKDTQIDFWTSAAPCLDLIDSLFVRLFRGDFEFGSIPVSSVEVGIEALEWTLFTLKILFTDELGAVLQCLDRLTHHWACLVKDLDEGLVLAWVHV